MPDGLCGVPQPPLGSEVSEEKAGCLPEDGALTLGLLVSMLYHRMDAQALGIWQMLEITTTGKEWVCGASGR